MKTNNTKQAHAQEPEATDGDRELAFARKWIDMDESEGVQRTVLKELRDLIASHVAARLAPVEAEVAEWKNLALDAEERREAAEAERDALFKINGDLARLLDVEKNAESERDALRATVAKMREAMLRMMQWDQNFETINEIGEVALQAVPADLADSVCVKRSALNGLIAAEDHPEDFVVSKRTANASESRCAALAKECESLRADKERLDWLQDVWDACEAADDVGPWERVYCASKAGASLRSAIDAARADAARKEQP